MENTYGYNPLSYELISLFRSGAPDFAVAEELIRRGADVNDQGADKDENVLTAILEGYWDSCYGDMEQEICHHCESYGDGCRQCEQNLNPNLGESMLRVIRFFLDHGFDVDRNDGLFGAQVLCSLTFSSFNRYMIDATKLLLDAGAKNIPVEDGNPYSTPMEWILTEASFRRTSEIDHALGNIYEAVFRIFLAQEEGRPYHGIDSYETAVGKKILRVLADAPAGVPVFTTVCTDRYCHENCFSCDFYFQFDGGYLVYCRDASCFVDTVPPSAPLVDVSACFPQMIGQTIENISFSHHSVKKGLTYYGQPVTIFHLSNGEKISFTINFGEEDKEHYVAYCF